MSELLNKQQSLLHSVTRALDNFRKIGRNNYTAAKIRSRMTTLKDTWAQCIEVHANILQLYPADKRDKVEYFNEDQLAIHEDYYQQALDYMAEALEEFEPCVTPNQSLNCTAVHYENSSFALRHLPPIQLPPFSGKYEEWESFRDRFDALIIQNKELSDFSRMHFLASTLTDRAKDTIAGLTITADNFESAWKALSA